MTEKDIALICFRQDLRIHDHPALSASAQHKHLVACFVLDDITPDKWRLGGASRWWLYHSLSRLTEALAALNIPIILRQGVWSDTVKQIALDLSAKAVYFSRAYEPYQIDQEKRLYDHGQAHDFSVKRYAGHLLFEPEKLSTQAGQPFKVYTPFWRALTKHLPIAPVIETIAPKTPIAEKWPSDKLSDWDLLPTWPHEFDSAWTPGEAGAHNNLARFVSDRVLQYREQRNIPSQTGTARLSPHLRFGEISPRQVWHEVMQSLGGEALEHQGSENFLREIGWREFSYHLLFHWPTLPEACFRTQFNDFPWQEDDTFLKAWQKGQTGIPIIDAGMRELWHTGWMHNRVRMIVASFLTKNGLINWRSGAQWFWDTLVDADLASNSASWQWSAGSGADAAPYFRIFNPVTQSEKFDPEGGYIRRWVPELETLCDRDIHAPWQAKPEALEAASLVIGSDYPHPITDLALSRKSALTAYETIKLDRP